LIGPSRELRGANQKDAMNQPKTTRRNFISGAAMSAAAAAAAPRLWHAQAAESDAPSVAPLDQELPTNAPSTTGHYRAPYRLGLGGVAVGSAFKPTTDAQAHETLEAAWAGGVRYYDTSPWYGLGLSERRFGHFLHNQKRDDYVLSIKVGRILKAGEPLDHPLWKKPAPFRHTYDYTAAGARRSVEDSLQRLGVERIDMGLHP
jgi:D-threo-aldose 1-dehydrogenase